MIHFDFIVTDLEGETIFDGIQELINETLSLEMKAINTKDSNLVNWCHERVVFLKELKNKMKNRRIEGDG